MTNHSSKTKQNLGGFLLRFLGDRKCNTYHYNFKKLLIITNPTLIILSELEKFDCWLKVCIIEGRKNWFQWLKCERKIFDFNEFKKEKNNFIIFRQLFIQTPKKKKKKKLSSKFVKVNSKIRGEKRRILHFYRDS